VCLAFFLFVLQTVKTFIQESKDEQHPEHASPRADQSRSEVRTTVQPAVRALREELISRPGGLLKTCLRVRLFDDSVSRYSIDLMQCY
jgi:hypothetical protein